jgi:hypothetical protein
MPCIATAARRPGRTRRPEKPVRIRGRVGSSGEASIERERVRASSAADTKKLPALTAKKDPTDATASSAAATAQPPTRATLLVAVTRPLACCTCPLSTIEGRGAKSRREIGGCGRDYQACDHDFPEWEVSCQPGHGDRKQDDAAHEIGGDHRAPAIPTVGHETAVEPEEQRGQARGQPHCQDTEWAAEQDGGPKERHELEGLAELTDCAREVGAPKVWLREKVPRAGGVLGRFLAHETASKTCHATITIEEEPGRPAPRSSLLTVTELFDIRA